MINFLKGTVARKKNNLICLRVGDIGYEIILTPVNSANVKTGDALELIIHSHIREDAHDLFGFKSFDELDFFRLLISVSGVGPKSACNILSLGEIDEIKGAIGRSDVQYMTKVSGIGKKTAERIVVELKDKLQDSILHEESSDALGDVVDALVTLGYKKAEAQAAVRRVGGARVAQAESGSNIWHGETPTGQTTEQILRAALKQLAG